MYDQRTSHEVSQSAVLGIQQHGDNPYPIKTRKPIHHPQKIAGNSFKGINRTAGFFNDADSRPALAGSLSFPERFKKSEISPEHAKISQDDYGSYPEAVGPYAREHGPAQYSFVNNVKNHKCHELDQGIGKNGHKAAAEIGQSKFKVYLFGCVNGKLVSCHDDFNLLAGKEKEPLAPPGMPARPESPAWTPVADAIRAAGTWAIVPAGRRRSFCGA